MPTFYLTGDICHPGTVRVSAPNENAAYELAERGEFEVVDEQHSCLRFEYDGLDPNYHDEATGKLLDPGENEEDEEEEDD